METTFLRSGSSPVLAVCIAVLFSLSVVQGCVRTASEGGATAQNADPCQCDSTTTPPFTCDPRAPPSGNAQRPPLATTILLPSDASNSGALPVGGRLFTLEGTDIATRFTNNGAQAIGFFFLAPLGAPNCGLMTAAGAAGAAASNVQPNSIQFNIDSALGWTTAARTIETEPRLLCYTWAAPAMNDQAIWTGLRIAVSWNCDTSTSSTSACTAFNPSTGPIGALLTQEQQAEYASRTTCCKSGLGLQVGTCINPRIHSCCGVPFQANQLKCCSSNTESVQFVDRPCPCTRAGSQTNPTDCPASEPICCLPTKYPEFNFTQEATGQCYNATSRYRCCNTGYVYDSAVDQCCVVNGVQSLNTPCPCSDDTHCRGGQTVPIGSGLNQTLNHQCCSQTNPIPWEAQFCSIYSNYPSGTGAYQAQRCLGNCFDPAYQICCNGRICISEFENCCNNTCCNTHIGSCREGRRAYQPTQQFNWVAFNDTYMQCSTIEQMNPMRVFWIFILPTGLLLAALIGLALALTFANKASTRSFTPIDRAWIIVAVLVIFLAIPLFFSPQYKYGLLVLIAALFSILSAAIRSRILNILAIVVILIVLLYLYDPFAGNSFLNMTSGRLLGGEPDPERNGVLESHRTVWRNATEGPVRDCTRFYDYFAKDPDLHDFARYENEKNLTFGYCSRGWAFALLMFTAALLILMALLFVLALLDLMRFRANDFEPVELEVHPVTPEDAIVID